MKQVEAYLSQIGYNGIRGVILVELEKVVAAKLRKEMQAFSMTAWYLGKNKLEEGIQITGSFLF